MWTFYGGGRWRHLIQIPNQGRCETWGRGKCPAVAFSLAIALYFSRETWAQLVVWAIMKAGLRSRHREEPWYAPITAAALSESLPIACGLLPQTKQHTPGKCRQMTRARESEGLNGLHQSRLTTHIVPESRQSLKHD
ncbi:hypothetical protein F4680DRAFT_453949 [Xylaria scruposa]|nr:hypothetical protein F4680DRAFT_453949 [Xylaria scruposa]